MSSARDFPFYNGKPRPIGLAGWALVLAATALAFAALVWPISALTQFPLNFIQTILFAGLPLTALAVAAFLARTAIQLLGEEVVTILPLLAVLWFCVDRLHLLRGIGVTLAVALSTIWFSALHLPTYSWNYVQCFGIIGSARLTLTLAYLVTRNLSVSTGAHIVNDWSIFILTFAGSHIPIEPGA